MLYFNLKYRPEERSCFEQVREGLYEIIGKSQTHDVQGAKARLDRVKVYFEKAFNCASVI